MAEFPQGIKAYKPHENAPDFVKASIQIDSTELMNWLTTQNPKVNLQLKESKKGTYYLEINTYQR